MTTVQDITEAEAIRLKQKAAFLVAADLCDLGLPPAHVAASHHTGLLYISLSGFGQDAVETIRAGFESWACALGVPEFTETENLTELELKTEATYNGVLVMLTATVRGLKRATTSRTVNL